MVEVRESFRSIAAPTCEVEKLIVSRKLVHGGKPGDPLEGRQPRRRSGPRRQPQAVEDKSTDRIDGIVAIVMALGRAMLPEEPASSYQMFILG